MIERLIKNELTLRRYRKFKAKRPAMVSLWLLAAYFFFSFTAEIWANSKPVLLHYQGEWYTPVLRDYHPTEFGRTDIFKMDYRALKLGEDDFAVWPAIQWDPFESNTQVYAYPSPPTATNWFGTDDRGRDVAARLLYGFRMSMIYAVVIGAHMGYFGGWVDLIGQRLLEVWESMPMFMLLLTLITIFKPNLTLFIVISALFGWMNTSVYVRAEFLKLRRREFVEAGRAIGASNTRLIFRHILPNALGPALTFAPFVVAGGIAGLAALDYLGFGLQPPTPSWGELLAQARNNFTIAWWLALFPSLALFSTLFLLSLIGDAIRDAFDPRSASPTGKWAQSPPSPQVRPAPPVPVAPPPSSPVRPSPR